MNRFLINSNRVTMATRLHNLKVAVKMTSDVSLRKSEQVEFYKSYENLCTLKQLAVRSIKETEGSFLEILGDNVPLEEWGPILISLERDQSLAAISVRVKPFSQILAMEFEEQVREYCTRPILHTRFVLMNLMKALCSCLCANSKLQSVTLDGVHLSEELLDFLGAGLVRSRSVEMLALRRCGIRDSGLASVCLALRDSSNIQQLDLSQCDITDTGTQLLADLVAHQRRVRVNAGWTPDGGYGAESFLGVRRLTLNNNPGVGDQGALRLAAALGTERESWIRALDLQDCGLTDRSAIRFLELLDDGHPEMEVVDIRVNEVSPCIVREVLTAAGGTLDFPLLPLAKKISIHPPMIEISKQDADCFNSSAINIRQRPSSNTSKSSLEHRVSLNSLPTRKPSSYSKQSKDPSSRSSPSQLASTSDDRVSPFCLDLQSLELSDSSMDSERTILRGLDEVTGQLSASELKKRGQEITDAIEAARKRRLSAEAAVKKAEDEMREVLNTIEKERLLREEGLRKREEITGLIREIDDEEMKRLALREMGRMVRETECVKFRRLKSEGDLTTNDDEEPTTVVSTHPQEPHSKKSYREVSELLEQHEQKTRLNSLEFAGGLEVGRPKTANRVEAVLNKRHGGKRPDRPGERPKPRASPADIFQQLCNQQDGTDGASGRSPRRGASTAKTNTQSVVDRITAALRETTSTAVVEEIRNIGGNEF